MAVPDRDVRITAGNDSSRPRVTLVRDGKSAAESLEITNLSRRGMFCKTATTIRADGEIGFIVGSGEDRVEGLARLRWVREEEHGPWSPRGIGMQILEFHDESEQNWFRLLERYLEDLRIPDLMAGEVPVMTEDTDLGRAYTGSGGHEIIVVTDANGAPAGLAGVRHLHALLFHDRSNPDGLHLADVMEPVQGVLSTDDEPEALFRLLKIQPGTGIPVTTEGRVVGLVTPASVMPLWSEMLNLQALRLRQNFKRAMDFIVHDLRNPVGVIQTSVLMLEGNIMTPDQFIAEGYPALINDNCTTVLRLIDELLQTGEEEYIPCRLSLQETDLAGLLRETVRKFRPVANDKDIRLKLTGARQPVIARVDPLRMDQVLCNLISNAIKYSSPGDRVAVTLGTGGGDVNLEVRDTGQGIAADELPKIFDEYCRISTRPTAGESSVGLGLSITKRLVERHKGTITVESTPGKGTVFRVAIPLQAVGN